MSLTDFRPQRRNANRHTPKGQRLLRDAIQANGWIGAITVAADGETFAGSQRLETVAEIGMDNPIVIDADGTRPIIVRRTDIATADDPRAVLLGIGDNQIAALDLEWDAAALSDALASISTDSPSLAEMCDDLAQSVGMVVPEPGEQQEPALKAACFVEIYCSADALDRMRQTLDEWAEQKDVTINIQG